MDTKYMRMALELARKGEGKVNPNPLVGAVVVKDNKIVGYGYHEKYGGAHAEVNALNMAGEKGRGGTIYVTLEPCSHYGKTPPCTEKIIEMGIKKCIVGCLDPNPLVAGRGVERLREAGVEVVVGVLEDECKKINRVFFKYITKKKSYLFLKCGITLDGKIATENGQSKWITNEIAREKVQKLRNRFMGIMVGVNTIVLDNPSLTSRIPNGRNPFRIVLDPNLKIPIDSKILQLNDGKNVIVTSKYLEYSKKIETLLKKNVKIIFLEGKSFSLDNILKEMAKLKIDGILLEGGEYLISKSFIENEIDEGEIFIAPKILGDRRAKSFISGRECNTINDCINLKNVDYKIYGDNISIRFFK